MTSISISGDEGATVETADGARHTARFLVDASGHGAVVGSRVGDKTDVATLKKIAFFAHYRGVPRSKGKESGNTIIVVIRNAWFWLIPITEELTSVGLVVDRDHFVGSGLQPEEILRETIAATPWVADRMCAAEGVTPVYARVGRKLIDSLR